MTLIVGFRTKHGGVLVADSQESVDDFKYSVLKLEPKKVGACEFVIAGAGEGDEIDALIERFERSILRVKRPTVVSFRDLLEKELARSVRTLRKNKSETGIRLLVAVRIGERFEMWSSRSVTLVPLREDKPTLIGFRTELYQHVADHLHELYSQNPSGYGAQLILIGLRVLELARRSCNCVDVPYSGAVISSAGIAPLDKPLLAELTESLTVFGAYLDTLLLACSDTAMRSDAFAKLLEDFKSTASQLRKDYVHTVGEMEFRKQQSNGVGYGIPFIPAGTVTGASLGADGKTVSFSVNEFDSPPALKAETGRVTAIATSGPSDPQKSED